MKVGKSGKMARTPAFRPEADNRILKKKIGPPHEHTTGSRRHDGTIPILVDFRRHHLCPKHSGLATAKRWFKVEIKEGVVNN